MIKIDGNQRVTDPVYDLQVDFDGIINDLLVLAEQAQREIDVLRKLYEVKR
jgi:hypothetical protein